MKTERQKRREAEEARAHADEEARAKAEEAARASGNAEEIQRTIEARYKAQMEKATEHLNEMNTFENNPWPLSFSYGRAMQSAALKIWAKDIVNNVAEAQKTVYARAKDNGLAAMGEWK